MTLYRHYKTGELYSIIDEVIIKIGNTPDFKGVMYIGPKGIAEKYVRSLDDFKMKFEEVDVPDDHWTKYRCLLRYKDGRQEIDHVIPDYDQDNNEYIPFEIEIDGHWFEQTKDSNDKCLKYNEVVRRNK